LRGRYRGGRIGHCATDGERHPRVAVGDLVLSADGVAGGGAGLVAECGRFDAEGLGGVSSGACFFPLVSFGTFLVNRGGKGEKVAVVLAFLDGEAKRWLAHLSLQFPSWPLLFEQRIMIFVLSEEPAQKAPPGVVYL